MTPDEEENRVGNPTDDSTTSSEESKPRATADMLRKKKARTSEVPFTVYGDDGEVQEVTLLLQAIGQEQYDDLLAEHPPTAEQKKKQLTYNPRTFAPVLLSRVCVEPKMPEEEWKAIWSSDDWNRGELNKLFMAATDVCTAGLDLPFIGGGFGSMLSSAQS